MEQKAGELNMSETAVIIAVANQKGGVGKTTTVVNLGAALAERGFRTLLLDFDPQGNASSGLNVDTSQLELTMSNVLLGTDPLENCIEPTAEKNLFIAPSDMDLADAAMLVGSNQKYAFPQTLLRRAIDAVAGDFDYILIDCPPTLGLLTVNAFAAASTILAPVQCEYYALEGVRDLLSIVEQVQANINPSLEVGHFLLTMQQSTKLSKEVEADLRNTFGKKVFTTAIPRNVRLAEAPAHGTSILKFDTNSPGAQAYRKIAKELSHGRTPRIR